MIKTCGTCVNFIPGPYSDCPVIGYFGIRHRVYSEDSACPAYDDGSCDKAVDDLLRAAAEYLEVGTSSFRDSLEEAIEAVRVAKEEKGINLSPIRDGPAAKKRSHR